jgi:hypothetical protein
MKDVILGDIPTVIWTGKLPDVQQVYKHPTLTFGRLNIDE